MDCARLTLQILDGPDRGRVFRDLPLPLRIGRSADNEVQLNDPKIQPVHCEVYADEHGRDGIHLVFQDRLPLVDVLCRPGDMMTLGGATVLLVGSREEIAARIERIRTKENENAASARRSEPDAVGQPAAPLTAEDLEIARLIRSLCESDPGSGK